VAQAYPEKVEMELPLVFLEFQRHIPEVEAEVLTLTMAGIKV
jgi:hypothetical protein